MRIGTAVTSGSAAATGGRAVQGLPGPRSAWTATVSSSRSAGTRMNRAVWYLAAVLPARVRHALPAGAAQPGQGWRSTAVAASPGTLSIRKVSHNCLAEPGGCARCCAKADLRAPGPDWTVRGPLSQLVIYDTPDPDPRGWVDLSARAGGSGLDGPVGADHGAAARSIAKRASNGSGVRASSSVA